MVDCPAVPCMILKKKQNLNIRIIFAVFVCAVKLPKKKKNEWKRSINSAKFRRQTLVIKLIHLGLNATQ